MNVLAKSWAESVLDLRALTLLRPLLERPPIVTLLQRAEAAAHSEERTRHEAAACLIYELSRIPIIWEAPWYSFASNPWEAWLIHHVIAEENAFATATERGSKPSPLLRELFARDLRLLESVRPLWSALTQELGTGEALWQQPANAPTPPHGDALKQLTAALCGAQPWDEQIEALERFFHLAGAGPFNQAGAFTWDAHAQRFSGVRRVDPVQLEHLIGYDRERQRILENTERMLASQPAHNLLLYGDRGTGKSATVKALVHAYQDRGLKLIEVSKRQLASLPHLVSILAERALSFILFVDDLSFEDEETEYKELKALLEGSIQAPTPNVKVYATSNRRHLIRESFADRAGMERDVRARDTLEEKLSLADRFGLTIIFAAPDEQAYLEIVRGLAEQRGIDLQDETLARKALQWAQWQNGRSARTARQFIDSL